MSEPLSINDVCIGQHFVIDTDRNGMECVIIGGLQDGIGFDRLGVIRMGPAYLVHWADGEEGVVAPRNLRKKRPPQEYAGELRIRELFNQPPVTSPANAEVLTA